MTAKPETVGVVQRWRLRSPKDRADYMSQERDGQYVLFTDHESALAELQSANHRLQVENTIKTRAIDRWVPCPDHRDKTNDEGCYMCQLESANKRYERLISGLEALAGEWEKVGSDAWANELRDRIRALIPAAANTESEEGS